MGFVPRVTISEHSLLQGTHSHPPLMPLHMCPDLLLLLLSNNLPLQVCLACNSPQTQRRGATTHLAAITLARHVAFTLIQLRRARRNAVSAPTLTGVLGATESVPVLVAPICAACVGHEGTVDGVWCQFWEGARIDCVREAGYVGPIGWEVRCGWLFGRGI